MTLTKTIRVRGYPYVLSEGRAYEGRGYFHILGPRNEIVYVCKTRPHAKEITELLNQAFRLGQRTPVEVETD